MNRLIIIIQFLFNLGKIDQATAQKAIEDLYNVTNEKYYRDEVGFNSDKFKPESYSIMTLFNWSKSKLGYDFWDKLDVIIQSDIELIKRIDKAIEKAGGDRRALMISLVGGLKLKD